MNKQKNLSITFLLPFPFFAPNGGYKMVFEYANRLAHDNFNVSIIYPHANFFKNYSIKKKLKYLYRYLIYKYGIYSTKKGIGTKWFNLDSKIKEKYVFSFDNYFLPNSDIYIATSINTAEFVKNIKNKSKKFYLIQGFENWGGKTDEQVFETYKYNLKNIVVSNWLYSKVTSCGATCYLVKNGYDFNYFKISNPIQDRDPYCISMLYHKDEIKGCKYGFKALEIAKKEIPELKVIMFGTPEEPQNLPSYVKYYSLPTKDELNTIYNSSSIFLGCSLDEGWGLPIGEAMINGNAIVCTNNKGYKEMVINEFNGLICEIKDYNSLAKNIIRLMKNPKERIKLALNGASYIKNFNLEDSYNELKKIICS